MTGRDEKREQMDHSRAAGLLRWKWPTESDLIHSQAQHLSNASRSSSQEPHQSIRREDDTSVCSPCTTSASRFSTHSFHTMSEIAMYPPRGEKEAGYMWQMKRAMNGTRRASRLFQEHVKGFLGEAGHAALKVRHQVYYCLEADSMVAIHGDGIIAEGEPEKLNRLEEVLVQKLQSSPGSKDLGKRDPEAFFRVGRGGGESVSARYRHQRFRVQPRKLGNLRLARLARYLVGTQKLTFRFDYQEKSDIVNSTKDILWLLGLHPIRYEP